MRLVLVELRRFVCRRAIRGLLLLGVGVALLTVLSTAYDTRPVSATERAAAGEQLTVEAELEDRACRADPEGVLGPGATPSDCPTMPTDIALVLPRAELDLEREVSGRGEGLVVLLAVLGLAVGATFAGADLASGSLTNQLLFVPRRGAVWAAKAVAVMGGAAAGALGVLAMFWLSLQVVAWARGLGASGTAWREIAEASGRGVLLVTGVALAGFALAMLLRSTAATLGVVLVGLIAGELALSGVSGRWLGMWSPTSNVFAWLSDGLELYDPTCGFDEAACLVTLSAARAAAYLTCLLALAVVASLLVFRRRDVR